MIMPHSKMKEYFDQWCGILEKNGINNKIGGYIMSFFKRIHLFSLSLLAVLMINGLEAGNKHRHRSSTQSSQKNNRTQPSGNSTYRTIVNLQAETAKINAENDALIAEILKQIQEEAQAQE